GEMRRWAPTPAAATTLGKMQEPPAPAIAAPQLATDDVGPAPSAALDAAFDASIQLLRRQRPKLRAGFAAITRRLQRVGAALHRGQRATRNALRMASAGLAQHAQVVGARLASYAQVVGARAASASRWVKQKLMSRGSTVWLATGGVLAVGVLVVTAFHTATASRSQSRCPTGVAMDGRRPFGVLVDSIRELQRGSALDVRYDVCGLNAGSSFKTRVAVSRAESGRKPSSADRLTQTFEETASGIGMRVRHTLEVGSLPAGSYRLTIAVTDAQGRRRERESTFRIVDR
ncbi:MAG TPA: hypothetical protein VE714_09460, partial [Gemmatimonadales bacterium]|nr:hypothetical protein [Gemmatimonadales bacterium]